MAGFDNLVKEARIYLSLASYHCIFYLIDIMRPQPIPLKRDQGFPKVRVT